MSKGQYIKIEVDNPVCRRRFHLAWEEADKNRGNVKIACPHCSVTIFEAENHPPVVLLRAENLVVSPDGTRPQVHECRLVKLQQ